jgi:biopolymer transport protein ExbD
MQLHTEEEVVKKAELSLTPMIDVVFLLLIFFMVGMKFKELDRKLEANLPQQGEDASDDRLLNEIWVYVKNKPGNPNQPQIIIDQVPMRNWTDVRDKLHRLSRVPNAKKDPVLLVPDATAKHGWVMKCLDILNQIGYKNISFKQ